MYFEQKIIDGILCHRGTPDGDWVPYSPEDLTGMLENYHKVRSGIMQVLDDAANYDYLRGKSQTLLTQIYNFPY